MLEGEAKAYEKANKKLRDKIELEKKYEEQSKKKERDANITKFKNNTIEVTGFNWDADDAQAQLWNVSNP